MQTAPYESEARRFYARLADALSSEEERQAYLNQVATARIEQQDSEHDGFVLPNEAEVFPALRNTATLEAIYVDLDGVDVTVLVHITFDGKLSWAERFRYYGDPIRTWPPSDAASLRLSRETA